MIFPGMWYLRVSWKSSLPSSIKTGSCGIKGKDLGNEDYNMEKLANFLVGILYGCCMDLVWKLTINFPNMEIVLVFQTWILSSYQFGLLRYWTWISQIWARTSCLAINKTLFGCFGNWSTYWDFPFPKHEFSAFPDLDFNITHCVKCENRICVFCH